MSNVSKEVIDQINKEADDFGFQVPFDGTNEFYDHSKVKGYQAGATKWAEVIEPFYIWAAANGWGLVDVGKYSSPESIWVWRRTITGETMFTTFAEYQQKTTSDLLIMYIKTKNK